MLRLMMDGAPEIGVILFDRARRITFWNAGAVRLFGHAAEAMLGAPAARLFVPEDVQRGADRQEFDVAQVEGVAQDDRWHLRADGSRFWASGFLVRVRAPDGRDLGFGKVLRNRTDIKEQLEALRSQVQAAERRIEQNAGP